MGIVFGSSILGFGFIASMLIGAAIGLGTSMVMGSLGGAIQRISAPPIPPPPPTPEVEEEQVKKFQKKRKGRAKTIITGDLTPETLGKKTLLGG